METKVKNLKKHTYFKICNDGNYYFKLSYNRSLKAYNCIYFDRNGIIIDYGFVASHCIVIDSQSKPY